MSEKNSSENKEKYLLVDKVIYKSADQFILFKGRLMKLNRKTGEVTMTSETDVYRVNVSPEEFVQGDVLKCTHIVQENYKNMPCMKIEKYSIYRTGVLIYVQNMLMSACRSRNSKIRGLVRDYGEELVSMVDNKLPEVLKKLKITNASEVKRIETEIKNTAATEAAKCFQKYNLSADKLSAIISYYRIFEKSEHVSGILSYYLDCVDGWYGFCCDGFLTFAEADMVAKKLLPEIKCNDYRRLLAAISAVMLDSKNRGDAFLPKSKLVVCAIDVLGVQPEEKILSMRKDLEAVLKYNSIKVDADGQECSGKYFVICDDVGSDDERVYMKTLWTEEKMISNGIKMRLGKQVRGNMGALASILDQFRKNYYLSNEQALAVETLIKSPISILTGGPGTGKSHTIRALVYAASKLDPNVTIQLAAPTGKAATRLKGITNDSPSTLHKLFHLNGHTQNNTVIEPDILVIDEFSMVDMWMMCEVLRLTSKHTQIVLVGDANQLPSIGPGSVLHDLIKSGLIPVMRLTEIHRTDGKLIIKNAEKILSFSPSQREYLSFKTGGDMEFIEADECVLMSQIAEQYMQCIARGKTVAEIAVLCARKDGYTGTIKLNQYLQSKLQAHNSGFECASGKRYYIGDPVIQTVNDYDIGLTNGEVGIVRSVNKNKITVRFPGHQVDVDYDMGMIATDLDLAYAMTIHKSQGSEFSTVLIPVSQNAHLHKTLFYTAVTRARDNCILIGDKSMISRACKLDPDADRYTALDQRLQGTFFANKGTSQGLVGKVATAPYVQMVMDGFAASAS